MLTTLLAAAALLATLTSWRLVLLTGFLLTTLLATLLLAALLFATHHDSPSRNDFRPNTMFSERICSPLEFLHTKEHFRAGRNNVPLEYAFAVPHKKKLKFQMRKNCSEAQTAHLCIIGVGGFLGAGEKSIKRSKKDNKTYTML